MADDIELAINLIQAQNRTFIPDYAPDLIDYPTAPWAQTPAVLTWPSDGSWYQKGHGYKTDERTMQVMVYVEPLGLMDIPTRAQIGVQLLQQMRKHYMKPDVISLDTGVTSGYQITIESRSGSPQSDTGLMTNLAFGATNYLGFILRLRVRIMQI